MFEVWNTTANFHYLLTLHEASYSKPIWQPPAFPSKLRPSTILQMILKIDYLSFLEAARKHF